MAVFNGQVMSNEIGMDIGLSIILPHDRTDKVLKVLYLLHGLSDGCTAWTRWTRIEKYATERGYIVIMPEVHRSFYTNMAYGGNYKNFILDELPTLCEKMFGIPRAPKNTYIAGLSMGGYGAMKCALTKPEQYRGCAALSGVCDVKTRLENAKLNEEQQEVYAIMGDKGLVQDEDNLYTLVEQLVAEGHDKKPELFIACGTEDFLYESNKDFVSYLKQVDYKFQYIEAPGTHNWEFWDCMIQKAMDFFEEV